MLTPSNRTITIASGGTALVGRTTAITGPTTPPPAGSPAWLANAPIGQWYEIPGTAYPNAVGNGGKNDLTNTYSGMAVTPSGLVIQALGGGHQDGDNNEVKTLDLMADNPATLGWVLRNAASPTKKMFQPYNPDGKPAARHNYEQLMFDPVRNRVMLIGARNTPPNSASFPTVDGFNLDTNTWDAAGYWPYCTIPGATYSGKNANGIWPEMDVAFTVGDGTGLAEENGGVTIPGFSGGLFGCMIDPDGTVWSDARYKWPVGSTTWQAIGTNNVSQMPGRSWAYDTTRNQAFGVCYGDGAGNNLGAKLIGAVRRGNVATQITFSSGSAAALTLMDSEYPQYCANVYDPINDEFIFFGNGVNNRPNTAFYIVKPNNTNVWDVTTRSYGGTALAQIGGSGINNRAQYMSALKGVICFPCQNRGGFFLRLA